jgi:hypothetical protein
VKFYITAHDTFGIVTLHRDSVHAAIKKASELMSDGCLNVEIVMPDGTTYDPGEFQQLKERVELWPKRQPAEATLCQGGH